MSIHAHPSPSRLRTQRAHITLMSSVDRAIPMRLAHVRAAALSLAAGGFLTLGVLASVPGTARASALGLAAATPSAGTSTSANANTNTTCQALPAASTPSPSPTPAPAPSPSPSPSISPSASSTASASPASPSNAPHKTGSASPSGSVSSPPSGSSPASGAPSGSVSSSQPGSASPSSSQTSATASASPTLAAYVAASPGTSASAASPPKLCVSVQRSQSSLQRGQTAAYVVQVSTQNNGSASNVSVALAAQPAGQKATFTSGCAKGGGTATCTVSSVSDKQPAVLHAQIPVASSASSVTSVT